MKPEIETMADLVALLRVALVDTAERMSAIQAFQNYVWHRGSPIPGATEEQWDTLNDLADLLDYYEPDPLHRDGDYYGDPRLESETRRRCTISRRTPPEKRFPAVRVARSTCHPLPSGSLRGPGSEKGPKQCSTFSAVLP